MLRYVEDRSVDEGARLLDLSTGIEKSQAARGLAKLREIVGAADGTEVAR